MFRLGFLPSIWQRWLDVCFVSSTKNSLIETIGYIKVHLSTLTNLFVDPVNLLMQRHDDEVRNNVIHPLCDLGPCPPPLPSSRYANAMEVGEKPSEVEKEKEKKEQKRKNRGKAKQKERGVRMRPRRKNKKCHNCSPSSADARHSSKGAAQEVALPPPTPLPCSF